MSKTQRQELVDIWEDLPIITKFDERETLKGKSANLRLQILIAFSKGIRDKVLDTQRHALSANELFQVLSDADVEITKSNLYYHLSNLKEKGLVKMVLKVKSGRFITKYYSRTSKLFYVIPKDQESDEADNSLLLEILKQFDNDPGLLERISKLNLEKNYHEDFYNWVITHESKLLGIDVDLMEFSNIYRLVKLFDEYGDELTRLGSVFEIT